LRVDGNDFLAVYAATKWAADRARGNHGATLIELFTYRAGSHSTSDDPTRYRPQDDPQNWPLGDPVERLKRHLIRLGEWSKERHEAQEQELTQLVRDTDREAQTFGTLGNGERFPVRTMFEDVYKEMPWNLRRQLKELEG
jgi:2-oxoisovalerate dehydrogenase E1 component alpha subunit